MQLTLQLRLAADLADHSAAIAAALADQFAATIVLVTTPPRRPLAAGTYSLYVWPLEFYTAVETVIDQTLATLATAAQVTAVAS